jgi:hypothetical protein
MKLALARRDEVLAEWLFETNGRASLHVHCHVSGEERWLAPPALRTYIFQREMPLVRPGQAHCSCAHLQRMKGNMPISSVRICSAFGGNSSPQEGLDDQ